VTNFVLHSSESVRDLNSQATLGVPFGRVLYFHDPAVRQAVIAVGAVHRRSELGITPEAFEYCAFVSRCYAKALRDLNKALSAGESKSLELVMIVPILLCVFELFQDHPGEAKKHMNGWLNVLLSRQFRRLHTSSIHSRAVLNERTLRDLFCRLEGQAMELFQSTSTTDEEALSDLDSQLIPKHFETLEQARDVLFTLVHSFFRSVRHNGLDESVWLNDRREYGVRLLQWSCTYAEYFKGHIPHIAGARSRAAALLRIYRQAACLLLSIQPKMKQSPEMSTLNDSHSLELDGICGTYDESDDVYNAHFSRLITRANSLLEVPKVGQFDVGRPSLVIDSGTCSPRQVEGDNINLYYQVRSLLPKGSISENIYATMGAYSVAEKVAAMEGKLLLAWGAACQSVRATSMDIILFMEERKLLMRHCTPDSKDKGLVWTQDWMVF
jgi:hypothetical protein